MEKVRENNEPGREREGKSERSRGSKLCCALLVERRARVEGRRRESVSYRRGSYV